MSGRRRSTRRSPPGPPSGEELHAPDLLFYEVESALRGLVFTGLPTEAQAIAGLSDVAAIAVTLHPHPQGGRLLRMAERQRARAAYDAAYLVLAESLPAELWMVDRRLASSGRSLGISAGCVGDESGNP